MVNEFSRNNFLTGLGNDAFKMLEEFFPEVLAQFYEDNGFRKGAGAGGGFVGKTLSEMMRAEKLELLKLMLGEENGQIWVDYLASIRELLTVCNSQELVNYTYEAGVNILYKI